MMQFLLSPETHINAQGSIIIVAAIAVFIVIAVDVVWRGVG